MQCNKHISELKILKSFPKSKFAKYAFKHNGNMNVDAEKYSVIINKQRNVYLSSVLKNFLVSNQAKRNGFYCTLTIHTDFKHNGKHKCIHENKT